MSPGRGIPLRARGPLDPSTEALGRKLFRHVLARDPVPALPPRSLGRYAHFGRQYRYSSSGEWDFTDEPTASMASLRDIPRSFLALVTAGSRREAAPYAINAHPLHRYLDALRPAGRVTEFGD